MIDGILLIGKVYDGRGENQILVEEKEARVSKLCQTHYNIIHPLLHFVTWVQGRKCYYSRIIVFQGTYSIVVGLYLR